MAAGIDLRFPSKLARLRVDRHHEAVRRGVVNHVVVDGERLRSRLAEYRACGLTAATTTLSWRSRCRALSPTRSRRRRRRWPLIFPDEIAGRGVERLHCSAGYVEVNNALVDGGYRLRDALAEPSRPGEGQLTDVLFVHLIERTEALRIVCAAEHEPVLGTRIQEHLVGDGCKRFHLRENPGGENS